MTNAFKGMDDALGQFVMTGRLSFLPLANSIVADTRTQVHVHGHETRGLEVGRVSAEVLRVADAGTDGES